MKLRNLNKMQKAGEKPVKGFEEGSDMIQVESKIILAAAVVWKYSRGMR